MQLIVTKELSEGENLWLKSLTNELRDRKIAEKLICEYGSHKGNPLYESMMSIIVHANENTFKEVDAMCEALEEVLEEVMKDKLDARELKGKEAGQQMGIQLGQRKTLISLVCTKLSKGKTADEIADALETPEAEITGICQAAACFAPDYDVDKIYEVLYGIKHLE